YFVEGGRSRNGRLLPPRPGMLSMTVQSFVERRARPLAFVPVYIGYEKLPEGESYLREFGGRAKQSESLGRSLIATLRTLQEQFGKVYLNFGEPLIAANFLDQRVPDWSDRDPDPKADWFRHLVAKVGVELSQRVNAAAMVGGVNLLATALLAT